MVVHKPMCVIIVIDHSLWCSQTPHVTSQVVLLTASLCCFEIEILFGFTPEKADVSVGYIELLRA